MAKQIKFTQIKTLAEQLTKKGFRLVQSQTGEPYTVVPAMNGKRAKLIEYSPETAVKEAKWLLLEANVTPRAQLLKEAVGYLEHCNRKKGNVFVRVGEADGRIYVDLNDDLGRVVEVSQSGWKVLDHSPIHFYRPSAAGTLPEPKRGGRLDRLRTILGISDNDDWLRAVGWLFGALRWSGEHLLLALSGPAGSGKSTATRLLAKVLDPRDPQYLQLPYKAEDTHLAARRRWILALDEVDGLTTDKSRLVASLCTGSAMEVRRLYSDTETCVTAACPPMIINGMESILGETRIRDRSVPVTLTRLAEGCWREKSELEKEFVEAWPYVLGALFDHASAALRHEGTACDPKDQLRMTEAGNWIEKCLQAMGAGRGEFCRLVKAAQQKALAEFSGEWPPLPAIAALAKGGFQGTATELFAAANAHPTNCRQQRDWPKSANQLSAQLEANTPALAELGIVVGRSRSSTQRMIALSVSKPVSAAVPEPLAPEVSATRAAIGRALAATLPKALVLFEEGDGTYSIVGPCVEQAVRLLSRSPDGNGVLRVNQTEWELVNTQVEAEGAVIF